MQNLRFAADSVPRKRCHAISAKAGELRSTVSQGLQGLSPEELQARQLRQQQLQQHLAQQQAQRLQEQQEMQVSSILCRASILDGAASCMAFVARWLQGGRLLTSVIC